MPVNISPNAAKTGVLTLAYILISACGPEVSISLAPPLTLIDSFPSNGATLSAQDLHHLELVFSELVDGNTALDFMQLASLTDADEVDTLYTLYPDSRRGEGGVDPETGSLSALFDPDPDLSLLPAGERFRLRISKGLSARNGNVLPVDVERRFATVP